MAQLSHLHGKETSRALPPFSKFSSGSGAGKWMKAGSVTSFSKGFPLVSGTVPPVAFAVCVLQVACRPGTHFQPSRQWNGSKEASPSRLSFPSSPLSPCASHVCTRKEPTCALLPGEVLCIYQLPVQVKPGNYQNTFLPMTALCCQCI